MRALLLLGLAALAVATTNRIPNPRWLEEIVPESKVEDTEFRANRQYQFVYNGQLLTGIPQSSKQHSATRIQAVCTVQFDSDTQCLLKCEHIRMGKLNEKVVEPRKIIPFSAFEEVQIDQELKQQLQSVVKFTYTRGLISDIVFDGIEQPWSANIKRGVLNLLQVNLDQRGRTDRTDDAILKNEITETENKENDYFTAMEKTLEGECECDYTVTSQRCLHCDNDQKTMNVTKSVNFEKCRRRPDIKYNYRFSTPCPSCDRSYDGDEKMVRSSTVTQYDITGTPERFLINEVVCESQYNYVPMNEDANVITTYARQKLELVKSGPKTREIREPTNQVPSDSQMIFTPDWDVLKERFFQEGEHNFHQETPYSEIENKIEFVGQILRRLVRCVSESVEDCAPRQFVRLVKVLRMCKTDELNEIHNSFFKTTPSSFTPEDHKKIKDLLVDAMCIAGTRDTIKHMVDKIKKREVSPIKAALSIKNLMNVRVPSRHMIEQLLKLSEDEVCKRNAFLRQSVLLTCGSLMHGLCGEHEDKLAQEFKNPQQLCPRSVKQELVEKLFQMLDESQSTSEKILLLKTISNAGLDLSVFKLDKIIKNENRRHNTLVRTEAILALRRLRGTMDRKIQKILMPIYMNQRDLPEVRMVAVYQIMQTLPQRSVLDQISRQLFTERSRQVGSFVLSHLRSMANSTNPCEKRVADNLKLSLRHASKSFHLRQLNGLSKFKQFRTHSDKYDRDFGIDLGMIMSNSSYLPRKLAATLNLNSHSQWLKHLLTVGVSQKGAQHWLKQLYSKRGPIERSLDDILRRSPRSAKTQSPKNELKRIFEKLNIRDRYSSSEQDSSLVIPYLKFKDQEVAFLPISSEDISDSIREMIDNDVIDIRSIERMLEQGVQMDITQAWMMHEQSRKMPTILGLPLRTSIKVPLITRLTGQIRGKMEPNDKIRMVQLSFNLKPSMVLGGTVNMQCWSPIVNSGLKVVSQLTMYTPVHFDIKVDGRKNPVETELIWKPHRNQYQLVKAQTLPITYTSVWPQSLKNWEEPEERTIYGEEWNRVKTMDTEFGENSLGIKVRTHGSWHKTPSQRLSSTPFCPFSGPNKIQVTVQPGNDMPEEVIVKLTGKLFEQDKQGMKPKFNDFYDSDDESYFREDSDDSSKRREYQDFETTESSNNQLVLKVLTRGSSTKRTAEMTTNCRCDERYRHCKCDLDLKRSPIPNVESSQWKLNSELEIFYPETPYRMSDLDQDKTFLCQMKTKWGSDDKKEVEMKIQGRRSEKQKRLLEKESFKYRPECSSPVCQYSALKRAALLCDYKIDVDYTLGQKEQEIVNSVYRYFKNYYYKETQVDQINVRNPENQVRCHVTIDPENTHLVNITIKTPREECRMKDIPSSIKVRPVNIRTRSSRVRSVSEMMQRLFEPTMAKCQVRPRGVKTFDGVKIRVPYSQCYTVLAKDCSQSEQGKFAVLIKKDGSSKKQLKVVTEDKKIVLRSEDKQITVDIDGKKKECPEIQEIVEHGHVIVRIQKQGPYCKVSLPKAGVKVYFDGYAADIKMSRMYQNDQCGLCGHFDEEMSEESEFRNPQNQYVTLPEFSRSYLIQDNCEVEDEIQDSSRYSIYKDDNDDDDSYEPDWRSTKSGSCPSLSFLSQIEGRNNCQEECDSDDECSGSKKCCFNGCGHSCVRSEKTRDLWSSDRRRQPVLRTKVIEQGQELCFSKEPVPKCPQGTYPEYESEQKVVYNCLSRSGFDGDRADRYHRQSLRDVVQEVQNLPASFTQTEAIVKSCIVY